MTVSDATRQLEQLSFVTEAGAAPTDEANIPCFQVFLTDANAMNDSNEAEVRDRIRELMAGELGGELVIQSSKDVLYEGTEDETCCFWVYAFGSFGQFEKGGITYHVVEWNPDWGVRGVPTGSGDPFQNPAEMFKWAEIPLTVSDVS